MFVGIGDSMGDRQIYICPNCGDEIYVGGGINEHDVHDPRYGKIQCFSCRHWFVPVAALIDITHIVGEELNGYQE